MVQPEDPDLDPENPYEHPNYNAEEDSVKLTFSILPRENVQTPFSDLHKKI